MCQEIEGLLKALPGVVQVGRIESGHAAEIIEIEKQYESNQLIPLKNAGIEEVMKRDRISVILKSVHFRPPPCSTLFLVEEARQIGDRDNSRDNRSVISISGEYLRIDDREYLVIGEEVMDKNREYEENHMYIQGGLVLFPDRRNNRAHIPSFMIIPPIPFPELEEEKERFSISRIISVSPSTKSDDYIRDALSFPRDPELATILIGYDGGT